MKRSKNNGSQTGFSDYQNVHYPTLFEGMASVTDLHGILSQKYFEQIFSSNDQEALYSDWEKVGHDLFGVFVRTKVDFLNRLRENLHVPEGEITRDVVRNALQQSISRLVAQQNLESRNHEQA